MADGSVPGQSAQDMDEPRYDVILVYNSQDDSEAKWIHDQLVQRGLNVWIDYKHAFGGDPLDTVIVEAMKTSKTAIVLFGKKGLGAWQEDELALLSDLLKEGELSKLIPVLLSGVEKPPRRLAVAGRRHVRFTNEMDEPDVLDELERTITGLEPKHSRWPFEIHVPVASQKNECFVACPLEGGTPPFDLIARAVGKAGLEVLQFQHYEKPNFTPDFPKGIRGAEVVVVNCTPQEGKDAAAPEMLYELGFARALGKPTLVLTRQGCPPPSAITAKQLLEHNSTSLANGDFEKRLTEEIKSVVAKLHYPFLTEHDPHDIYAIPARLACVRIPVWRELRRILLFGIALHGPFRDVAKHAHKLQRDAHRVDDDWQVLEQLQNSELHTRNWGVFNSTLHKDYLPAHAQVKEACGRLLGDRHERVEHSFKFLSEWFLGPKNNSNDLLKKSLNASRLDFELACEAAKIYLDFHERLNNATRGSVLESTDPSSELAAAAGNRELVDDEPIAETGSREQAPYLCGLCSGLSGQADRVNTYVNEMMTTLLEVVAEELSIGGDEDVPSPSHTASD